MKSWITTVSSQPPDSWEGEKDTRDDHDRVGDVPTRHFGRAARSQDGRSWAIGGRIGVSSVGGNMSAHREDEEIQTSTENTAPGVQMSRKSAYVPPIKQIYRGLLQHAPSPPTPTSEEREGQHEEREGQHEEREGPFKAERSSDPNPLQSTRFTASPYKEFALVDVFAPAVGVLDLLAEHEGHLEEEEVALSTLTDQSLWIPDLERILEDELSLGLDVLIKTCERKSDISMIEKKA
ncbi:hypothetical protein EYF80_034931 [Liparis tanakae]|uniref:Uncharacterized protein n=1 Tax=Liparis tanakae TaxID=230148 RepID=A0A4Z2GNN9_9TELE|nr:hypothetical protein EYF80_034931 [Liparis tanakae]